MASVSGVTSNISPEDTIFTKATPEQQLAAWRLNGVSWAPPMSVEDYIRREKHLSEQDLTKDGGCDYWVLHHKDDPLRIIASCEATRKQVFIASQSSFREGTGYAIASVYTNPDYRRQGMATYMMRKLQEYMDSDEGNGVCSVLYSDIGVEYYAKLGWPVYPSEQATIYLHGHKDEKSKEAPHLLSTTAGATRYLKLDDLRPLCKKDTSVLRNRIENEHSRNKTQINIAFAPSYEQITWQLARSQYMARVIHKKSLENRGAITTNGKSWMYWDHDWREQKLKILRIVTDLDAPEEEQIKGIVSLLSVAAIEANQWGLGKLLVWSPDEKTTRAIKDFGNDHKSTGVEIVFDRRLDGSIPSFRWQSGSSTAETEWIDNQYYCWC